MLALLEAALEGRLTGAAAQACAKIPITELVDMRFSYKDEVDTEIWDAALAACHKQPVNPTQ